MRVIPYGREALLVEPDDASSVLPYARAAAAEHGVLEVVPAARTLLVRAAPGTLDQVATRLARLTPESLAVDDPDTAEVVLDVRYDGPDLTATADLLRLSVEELVQRHARGRYVVAFCGFAPGFGYLRGLDEALQVGRLGEPRTRVPAGSVGIAGEFTGVYPRESPGGWRLLGRTDAPLWDLDRSPPALLTPGTHVRFRVR
jgi:KipI family sensor histidine kinase inhibitor